MSESQVPDQGPTRAVLEELDEAECLRLIGAGGIGRIAYTGKFDLTVLPVNYELHDGAILFRTSADSLTASELRTGTEGSDYRVERADTLAAGVEPWPGGEHDHFIKVNPMRITGRRIRRVGP